MCEFSNDYPEYVVDEHNLLNFDEFCEMKYSDSEVQRLGFFKVRLHKDAKRETTLQEIITNFRSDVYASVKELLVCRNPVEGCGLHGHISAAASNALKERFMESVTPSAFHEDTVKASCCMESLRKHGMECFIEHFYSNISENAATIPKNYMQDMNLKSIANKIPKWQAAYKKRLAFQKETSIEEKSRVLQSCMELEKFEENDSNAQCKCKQCALTNLVTAPLLGGPSSILYSSGIDESYENHVKLTKHFSLMHLCFKNILSMTDSAFQGISFPAMYVGTCHSVFPLHVEDLSLWSFNFLLFGGPKFWIVVPPPSVAKLTCALARSGFGEHSSCINSLGHKFYIPSVSWLRRESIPFSVVLQREGEAVVLLPNAAHTGGNLSQNWAEACNFATKNWIPYGCVYPACSCNERSVHAVDLTPVIAVHARHLLRAYISNDVIHTVEDDYFQKSIVTPKTLNDSGTECAEPSSFTKKSEEKITCPMCMHKWVKDIKKRNVMNHLKKHHSEVTQDPRVVLFLKTVFHKK